MRPEFIVDMAIRCVERVLTGWAGVPLARRGVATGGLRRGYYQSLGLRTAWDAWVHKSLVDVADHLGAVAVKREIIDRACTVAIQVRWAGREVPSAGPEVAVCKSPKASECVAQRMHGEASEGRSQ